MGTTAADVMTTEFQTLHPDTPVMDAVRIFKTEGRKGGRRVFGMMVTDDNQKLVGMLSMYDILLFIRPKHIHIWGMMNDIDVDGIIRNACKRIRPIRIGDIMTADVVTVGPGTQLMMVLDIMIRKHIRRLPVVADGNILGVIYISDLFYHLLDRFGDRA